MTLVDLIDKKIHKNFEQTNNIQEADLVIYHARNNTQNNIVFVNSVMGN
jgi:hypothetical protein